MASGPPTGCSVRRALALILCAPLLGGIHADKQKHLAAGAVIGLGTAWTAKKLGSKRPWAWGLAAGITAGIAKELYDRKHPEKHTCEFRDALATAGGASLSFAVRF